MSRRPSNTQEETATCNDRSDGGINVKRTNSISISQGEAGTPQKEGGCCTRTASKINITVRTSSISIGQGEAMMPQKEGGCRVKTASEININTTVLPQVIITTLRPD
jgi:hypothetical protein